MFYKPRDIEIDAVRLTTKLTFKGVDGLPGDYLVTYHIGEAKQQEIWRALAFNAVFEEKGETVSGNTKTSGSWLKRLLRW
jgi:hypothetical protein